jgi:hypothetical protein
MSLWVALNDENVVRRYGIRTTHYGAFSEQSLPEAVERPRSATDARLP